MTVSEFSAGFDTLLQAYIRLHEFNTQEPLFFDEYEKSVFLTKALELLVVTLYDGKNSFYESFEKSEELRRELARLVKTEHRVPTKNTYNISSLNEPFITDKSYLVDLPDDVLFIIYESANLKSEDCNNGKQVAVVPVTHDVLHKTLNNPFRGPNSRRVLRLDIGLEVLQENDTGTVELISEYDLSRYTFRYIKKPEPIILVDLKGTGLSINTKTDVIPCELHGVLHLLILELAVRMAVQSKVSTNSK